MGFEIEWTSEARSQFDSLLARPDVDLVFVLKSVAGRRHDEWLDGRPFRVSDFAGDDIRLLEIGTAGLVYALHESEQRVTLLAILKGRPE